MAPSPPAPARTRQIGAEGGIALATALKANSVLTVLNLSGTLIGGRGRGGGAGRSREVHTSMAASKRGYACWHAKGGVGKATAVASAWYHRRAGNQGADAVCRALRTNSFLRELDMSRTPIDDKAANSIAQVGPCSANAGLCRARGAVMVLGPCWAAVGFCWSALGPLLATKPPAPLPPSRQMLAHNKGVERLLVTHTNITDQGAQLICNALQARGAGGGLGGRGFRGSGDGVPEGRCRGYSKLPRP